MRERSDPAPVLLALEVETEKRFAPIAYDCRLHRMEASYG